MTTLCLAILGASLVLLILTPCYSYLSRHSNHKVLTLTVKGLTTGVSLIFAINGYIRLINHTNVTPVPSQLIHNIWILIALGICFAADVMLEIYFITGGTLFFLGHGAYIVFFLSLAKFQPISILIFTVLCVAGLCYFYKYTPSLENLVIPFALYGMMISASLSIGILLPFSLGLYGYLPAVAILLLFCSDIMLARNKLVGETAVTRTLALLYYFAGQYLMAMTLYLPTIYI
ncbi:MAG: lysoplasmalogenase [Clostridiales bacterium]|nr:lysoplasmalogenase [Clostridiales bacterium]